MIAVYDAPLSLDDMCVLASKNWNLEVILGHVKTKGRLWLRLTITLSCSNIPAVIFDYLYYPRCAYALRVRGNHNLVFSAYQ